MLKTFALAGAVIGALLVTGCGGGGGSSPAPAPTASPTALIFTFTNTGGSSTIVAGPGGGGTLNSGAPVGGVSVASTWGSNSAITNVGMTAQLATGSGDVTSNTSTAFPLFTAAAAVDSNNLPLTGAYTAVDYLKITASPDTIFNQTPGIVVTVAAPASIAGKTSCSYFALQSTSLKWSQALTGTPSGSTITFTAQTLSGNNVVEVGNGSTNPVYLALACI